MLSDAELLGSTAVFLVADIPATIEWYRGLGFDADYSPPGFAVLWRDAVRIFLQGQPGYVRPPDPAAVERGAWDLYLDVDDVRALFAELSARTEVRITRGLCRQDYGQAEFDVTDPNGYVLVFAQRTGPED